MKRRVAALGIDVNDVSMTNKMLLAGREDFEPLRSLRQRPFPRSPVVVEVYQDSTRTRLEIVPVDGLEQVIERLILFEKARAQDPSHMRRAMSMTS